MECELDKFKFCKLWKKYSKIDHPLFPRIPDEKLNPSITARRKAWRAENAGQWRAFNNFKREVARRGGRWSIANGRPCIRTTLKNLMANGVSFDQRRLRGWADLFPNDISVSFMYDLDTVDIFKSI
jgi:hypothetical protein